MKKSLLGLCGGLMLVLVPCVSLAQTLYPLPLPINGKHAGEISPLDYRVDYHGSLGVTTVSASGISYAPFGFFPTVEGTILPEIYFGDYPLYFSGGSMSFTVHLKNVSKRTYRNLLVIAAQEFLNTDGLAGVPFPNTTAHNWRVEELRPGEEVELSGSVSIPFLGSSGIDQTHLQILHWDDGENPLEHIGTGRVLLDAPQAGLWCPLI